jgi:hypothetical protein
VRITAPDEQAGGSQQAECAAASCSRGKERSVYPLVRKALVLIVVVAIVVTVGAG